jgi:hypothetical protein
MNDAPTDKQLQLALAKMLPEKLHWNKSHNKGMWNRPYGDGEEIKETEWLHVCWLIEKSLPLDKRDEYHWRLGELTEKDRMAPRYWTNLNASWQQRAVALAKVKGIEIK